MTNAVTQNSTPSDDEQPVVLAHSLDAQAYNGNDLGAVYTKSATTFKVWAPTADHVSVKLYTTGSPGEEGAQNLSTTSMVKGKNGVWAVTLTGDHKNRYYTYLVTMDGITRETADVYAKAAGVNGNRSMVVDLPSTDPEGWKNDKHVLYDDPTDAIVWEVHVKDFSNSEVSGVSLKYRGKYLAFTEGGTTLNGEGGVSTCIDYLKKLGVTHVQLLPVYDYATVDESDTESEQFNWGYDPKNYNVPEGSYSTDPYDGNVRITEFKQMIMALHQAGIGVIMDVVYNHTYTAEGSWFEMTVPGYYYRMTEDGEFSDGSGCGNETASDHLMYRKYMIDSILYWVDEYHIDGFRFDLMGVHDITTMNEIRKALDNRVPDGEKIIMYGEPWTGGSIGTTTPTAVKANISQLNERIGAFNDDFRDAVKGHVFNALEPGFVQDGSGKISVMAGITANTISAKWSKQPSQTVTYTSAHDNYTLYDKLVLSVKNDRSYDERDEELVEMNKLVAALTLTSQGISFMQAGEEFARTKMGDSNSFNSSNRVNQLDWNCLEKYADLVAYYSGLMDIRRHYKPFRDATTASAKLIRFADTADGVIAYTLENSLTASTEWSQVAVLVNATKQPAKVTLPDNDGKSTVSEWVIIANKLEAGLSSLGTVSGKEITVPAQSAMILVDKASFEQRTVTSDKCTVKVEYKDAESGELLGERVYKGVAGESYATAENHSLDVEYDLTDTEGDTQGTFNSAYKTVTYYYTKFNGKILDLTVNYLKPGNETFGTAESEVSPVSVQKVREGSEYTAPIRQVDGMELDLSVFPSNAFGTVGSEDITVTYYYKPLSQCDLVLHFSNTDKLAKPGVILCVKEDGKQSYYTAEKGEEMTADPELGSGWYTFTAEGIGTVDGLTAYIVDLAGAEAAPERKYTVKGETWIERNTVVYSGTVGIIHTHVNGQVLATESISGKVGTDYSTDRKDYQNYGLSAVTFNASGTFSETPAYVIYLYEDKPVTERKEFAIVIMLALSSLACFLIAGCLGASYARHKKRLAL